jgi:hypothetical protein
LGEAIVGKKACKALRKCIMGMEKQKRLDRFFELMTA